MCSTGCRAACGLSTEALCLPKKWPLIYRTAVNKYYSTGGFTRGQRNRRWRHKGKCLGNIGARACRIQGRIRTGTGHRHPVHYNMRWRAGSLLCSNLRPLCLNTVSRALPKSRLVYNLSPRHATRGLVTAPKAKAGSCPAATGFVPNETL